MFTNQTKIIEISLERYQAASSHEVHYGIMTDYVREIIRTPASIRSVSVAEDCIMGTAEIAGAPIAIVDLGQALGEPQRQDLSHDGRIIVIEYDGRCVGFAVKRSYQMRILPNERVLDDPEKTMFISGYTKIENNRPLYLLDIPHLIADLESRDQPTL